MQFYVDSYLFITDRVARTHYYLQLRQNVINYNLANLTLERAFLLTSLALQAEKGNYSERAHFKSTGSASIMNSTFINNENNLNLSQFNEDGRSLDASLYFDPHDFMPKFIINLCESMGDNYVIENMPSMHREHAGLSKPDAEMLFIKEASEICPHNLHMYSLYKSNPSSFSKKASTVNSHFNAFFHGHHFNSSINSNSSHSSTMTNHSSTISGSLASNSNQSGHSTASSGQSKDGKVWLAISATGVQIFEQERQVFINKSNSSGYLDVNRQNQSLGRDSHRHPRDQLQDQPSTSVFYLRNKLSTFVWSDIEKLFFDKKKFEIRSNGYPVRKFTYYSHSDEMAKNLLWLCKFSHRFQLFIQPKLKEMKKRESELSRRKYRESYIYSENGDVKSSPNDKARTPRTGRNASWMAYQQEPSNKFLTFTGSNSNSLSASRNTLVGKESLNLSQSKDFHLRPLSDEMKPIMDQFDRQISKLQFNSDHNLIDLSVPSNLPAISDCLSSSNHQPASSQTAGSQTNNLPVNGIADGIAEEPPIKKPEKLEKSADKVDFMSGLDNALYFNQLNTNPFLNKSDYNQPSYPQLFNQPQQNLDEFVIEHKAHSPSDQRPPSQLTVQPSGQQSSLQMTVNEETNDQVDHMEPLDHTVDHINNTFPLTDDKAVERKSRQTFSLESLTCSNLSEPSSSGISEQEFSTSSCASASLAENRKSSSQLPSHLNNNQNNESSRCSSNTSYSSDSALGKCSSKPPVSKQTKPTMIPRMIAGNYVKQTNGAQKKPRHFAVSANDLRNRMDRMDATKKDSYFSTINNNHLLADFNNGEMNAESTVLEMPKPRARKSKFELKHKNKLNGMYKSLPNVNDFGSNSRFGRLDAIEQGNDGESERFAFLNRSDKSTSSEQSVSTIKSNTNCTSSSDKLSKDDRYSNNPFLGSESRTNWYQSNVTSNLNDGQRTNQDPGRKTQLYENIYENLPFQHSVNSLLNGNRTPTTSHSFVPAPHLITTTPNRIGTKIGVSSLNRCNKLNSPHHSNHKNHNLRLNLFNSSLNSPTILDRANMRTCSYQLLNNEHLSTINDPNQSTPFKTTRASSDPGVLTYSSTGNLMKIQSKDSCVFYQNSSPTSHLPAANHPLNFHNFNYQTNSPIKNLSPLSNPMFHRSLNNLNDDQATANHRNLAYDQPLINQISDQRKASVRKNPNFPMRYAESEMNLISDEADHQQRLACLPPPVEYASGLEKKQTFANYPGPLLMNGKLKATSEQQLNQPINQKLNSKKLSKPTDSIDNLQQLKQKSQDLDLPLITTLFNDRSLMINGIKTVPGKSRQKPKRYSLHLDNSATSDLNQSLSNQSASGSNASEPSGSYHQTNLDEPSIFDQANLHLKIDNNYNNLESNNLNAPFSAQNSRAEIIDKIWSDHFLN